MSDRDQMVPTSPGRMPTVDTARVVAEVQGMITVAQARPRDTQKAMADMRESCRLPTMAAGAFYSFQRSGERIVGPSIKLAAELARCWGNMTHGVRELNRDDVRGRSEMLAYAWDLQTNMRADVSFIVPHKRDKRGGPVSLTDMRDVYENNANAGARRLREMIFRCLPPWFIEQAETLCRQTLESGEGEVPLAQRVAAMVEAFAKLGVPRERIEQRYGALDKLGAIELANLGIVYRSIRRGEASKEEEFPERTAEAVAKALLAPTEAPKA